MIDVFYYYFYLFYTRIISDYQPHSRTVWALGVAFSFIINGLIEIPLAYFFSCYLNTIQKVIISVFVMSFVLLEVLQKWYRKTNC